MTFEGDVDDIDAPHNACETDDIHAPHNACETDGLHSEEVSENSDVVIDLTDVALRQATTGSPHPIRPFLDAKVRARRIALKRAVGRRRLRRLIWIGSIVGSIGLVWALFRSPLLDVNAVRVSGLKSALPESIQKVAKVSTGEAMIDIDVNDVARRISALPYVKFVEVDRQWPGTLRIKITERTAALAVALGSEFALVDESGVFFRKTAVRPLNVVVVSGIPGVTKPGDKLIGSASNIVSFAQDIPLSVVEMLGIDTLSRDDRGSYTMSLRSGQVVIVGDPVQARAKLSAVAAVLETKEGKGAHRIDVQVPELPVVGS